jgi:hypothetical protein
MKSKAIGQVITKLMGFEKSGKALDALEAARTAGNAPESPPENEENMKDLFEIVPAVWHRPELPHQAMTFDEDTGLPHVAMDRFPLPHDEEEDDALDVMV